MTFYSLNSAFSSSRPPVKEKGGSIQARALASNESSSVGSSKSSLQEIAALGSISGRSIGTQIPQEIEKVCQTVFELQQKLIPAEAQISTVVPFSTSAPRSERARAIESKRKIASKPGSIPRTIDHQRGTLEIRNLLGRGNFANVFSVCFTPRDSTEQRTVAMKMNQFESKLDETDYLKSSIVKEAAALRKISDYLIESEKESFIAECLFNDDVDPYFHFMIMPMYITDLSDLTKRNPSLFTQVSKIKTLARQLFQALDVLSSMTPPILHCDIKPTNIMIESASPLKIRLSDFGCVEEGNKQNEASNYIVTRWYRPPEIVLACPYGPQIDVWGVGCTLFEMHTRYYLFPADSNKNMFFLHAGLMGPIPLGFFESIPARIRSRLPVVLRENQYHLNFDVKKHEGVLLSKQTFDNCFPLDSLACSSSASARSGSDFREFLENIFIWSPEERLTPSQALMHPFLAIP